MKHLLCIVVLASLVSPLAINTRDNCSFVENLKEPKSQRDKMVVMFCFGYAEGLTEGVMVADIQRPTQIFCLPSEHVTNQQLVRVIRKYIADHPEKGHELTSVLAVEALRHAFPCRK